MTDTRTIMSLVYPGIQALDVTGPLDAFALASNQLERDRKTSAPAYRVELVAETAGPVRTMSGLEMNVSRTIDDPIDYADTLLIPGAAASSPELTSSPRLAQWISDNAARFTRIASVCNGALVLAQTGLLDGKQATTHWEDSEELSRRFPKIKLCKDVIYTRDNGLYTCAGITAGIDLALAMIEEDYGRLLSLKTAKRMVVFLKRGGNQAQFSNQLSGQSSSLHFGPLIEWMQNNYHTTITVDTMADRLAMSVRNFGRRFTREVGVTPAAYLENLRLELAKALLENSNQPASLIAKETGFVSVLRMRRCFQKHLGITPSQYRARFGQIEH
jgi:transcriptional regulator GlxA family with amidase domain